MADIDIYLAELRALESILPKLIEELIIKIEKNQKKENDRL